MIRLLLFLILIVMILRIIVVIGRQEEAKKKEKPFSWKGFRDYRKMKGLPKELGEYIDFEETRKKKK
ncbi:MAG: hypothetical protein U0X39_04775 [Bacteroidales bacterium]